MKFFSITQISNYLAQNLGCYDDVLNILEPSHQLYCRYSRLHNLQTKNGVPSTVSPISETLAATDAMCDLSSFSPKHLYSLMGDIQCAYECDLYSQLLLIYKHLLNHRSGSTTLDNVVEHHPEELDNDTLLPKLDDNINYLLYVNFFYMAAHNKDRKFIETKVAAINCRVLTYN
jgi:hypothetical protein